MQDGDVILLDAETGELTIEADLSGRPRAMRPPVQSWGYGRELFGALRASVSNAEQGASVCFQAEPTAPQPELRDVADPNVQNAAVDA